MDGLRFFDRLAEVRFSGNRLPHWQQEGAVYFVTFRLVDSIPQALVEQWEAERADWMRVNPTPWSDEVEREYHARFSRQWEGELDAGHGACVLKESACREIVAEALGFFDGERYWQIAWVVMPNHVHAVFALRAGEDLGKVVQSWKRFSARQINARSGRSGALWQRDYFDRIVRDAGHLAKCVRYVRRNPVKARLGEGDYTLYESDLARGIE